MKETLLTQFRTVQAVAQANLAGLDDEVSFHQSGGNCIHWLLGHLITPYNGMLPLLGGEPVWAEEKAPFSPRDDENETLGSLLALIAFHQSYHVGKIGLARRAAGVEAAFN